MANEVKTIWATTIAHMATTAAVANDAISAETADVALSSTNLLDYPRADIQLVATWASAPTVGGTIELYRQDLAVNGDAEPAPSTTYKFHMVGVFIVSAATHQHLQLLDVPLAKECTFQILNRSGYEISANWTLNVVPKTEGTA